MTQAVGNETDQAYTEAVKSGLYAKRSGLVGKYDNVRCFWEDQVTALMLRPALTELVERKKTQLERIRILDMGCGSGDGYDLIMGVTAKDQGIYENIISAITPDMLKECIFMMMLFMLLIEQEVYLFYHLKTLLNPFCYQPMR